MSATVASLKFVMGADTAEFERAMKNVEGAMKRASAVGSAVGVAIANSIGGAFTALRDSVTHALEAADKMFKLSQQIGLSTEKLSELRFAADLSGLSLESLTTSMTRLARSMHEAVSDNASTAARTLAAMGIAATDASGQLRPVSDVLLDIADKFSRWQDGAAKAALAMNLFGRAGAEMIPLLNAGRAGIQELGDEARRLGLIIDTNTGRSAERFNDTLRKLRLAWDGIITQLASRLVPTLEIVANWMLELNQKSQSLQYALAAVDAVIKAMVTTGIVAKAAFEALTTQIATLINVLKLATSGNLTGAWAALQQGPTDTAAAVQRAIDSFRELWGLAAQAPAQLAPIAEAMPRAMAPVVQSTRDAAAAHREWLDAQRAILDDIVNAPTETYVAKLDAINQKLREGVINQRTYGQMVRKVEEENRQNITSTASLVASTLTTVFGKSKAAGIAAAIINTAVGITNALAKLPPPWSWAQAALIAASGAAQIATIKSTNEKGGGGGAPSVHGGGAGSEQAAAAEPAQMFNINLHGSNFSRDAVVGLIEQMNEAMADGAQLVVNRR